MLPDKTTRGWVLAIAAIATFMVALDTLVVTTALTSIQRDLGASIAELEWTVNGYNLSFAVLILTAAAMGDRFGRRRIFVAGIALFTLASAACALSGNVGVLVAARVVQGVAAAAVMPLALTLVAAAFPAEKRGTALGLLGGLTGLAVAAGPLVGGAVVDGIDWHWIFWINVPIGVLLVPLALARVPESHGRAERLDTLGAALVSVGAFGLVWALVRANTSGWVSFEVIGSALGGLLVLGAFALSQMLRPDTMLPTDRFSDRSFVAGNAAAFLMIGSLFGAVFLMAQYFQTVFGDDPLTAGLRLLPWTATPMLIAPIAGTVADRVGPRPVLAVGLALQAVGLIWIGIVADASSSYGQLVLPLLIAGIGISMAIPSAQSAVLGTAEADAVGKAAGTCSSMRELGGVFGIAIIVAVFAGSGELTDPVAFADGFGPALVVAGALSALGVLAAARVRSDRAARPVTAASPVPAIAAP